MIEIRGRSKYKWLPVAIVVSISGLAGIAIAWPSMSNKTLLGLVVLFLLPILLTRIHFWVETLLFLSVATISLSVYQISLPGGQTLQVLRMILLIAIAISLLAGALGRNQKRIWLPKTVLALTVFLVYAMISFTLWGERNRASLSVLIAIGFGIIYALWLPWVVRDYSRLKLVITGVIVANILIVVFAIYQYIAWITGFQMEGYSFVVPFSTIFGDQATVIRPSRAGSLFRLTLPFGSSSHLGPFISAFMLITLPLQMSKLLSRRSWWWLTLYHSVMFLLLLATFSRGAWIGWIIGVLLIFTYRKNLRFRSQILVIIVIIIFAGLIIGVMQPDAFQLLGDRIETTFTEGAGNVRVSIANIAIDMFASQPLLGVGQGAYFAQTGIAHPHNIYLGVLSELGLIGFSLFSIWIASVLWYGHGAIRLSRSHSAEHLVSLGFLAAFVSILFNNFFQQSLYFSFVMMIAGMIGAMYSGISET